MYNICVHYVSVKNKLKLKNGTSRSLSGRIKLNSGNVYLALAFQSLLGDIIVWLKQKPVLTLTQKMLLGDRNSVVVHRTLRIKTSEQFLSCSVVCIGTCVYYILSWKHILPPRTPKVMC